MECELQLVHYIQSESIRAALGQIVQALQAPNHPLDFTGSRPVRLALFFRVSFVYHLIVDYYTIIVVFLYVI